MVAKVRRLAGQKRVGHAGTLDPLAEGVLPVLLGRATRLAEVIQSGRKTYRAVVSLGSATETDDAEGAVIAREPIPPLDEPRLERVLSRFRGEIEQVPPKYSALKVGGQRAYAVARRGDAVDLAPRTITVDDIRLLEWTPTQLTIEVTCSKGTYIRALARDIAVALGTVGHMSALLRTRVGPFMLEDAVTIDALAARSLADALLPANRALPDAPIVRVAAVEEARRLANGQALPLEQNLRDETVWVYDPDGRLLCLASAAGDWLRPRLLL